MRKIYFREYNVMKEKTFWPVAGYFQSSALPTELLGRIGTGRERGQVDKRALLKPYRNEASSKRGVDFTSCRAR